MPDDFSADTQTAGRVQIGGTVRGEIETVGDRDWFAVTLEAGKSYYIQVDADSGGRDYYMDPELLGIHDADGVFIPGTAGAGSLHESRQVYFFPAESGTYYISVGGNHADRVGTYEISVTQNKREGTLDELAALLTAGQTPRATDASVPELVRRRGPRLSQHHGGSKRRFRTRGRPCPRLLRPGRRHRRPLPHAFRKCRWRQEGVGGRTYLAWYGKGREPIFVGDKCARFGFVVVPVQAVDRSTSSTPRTTSSTPSWTRWSPVADRPPITQDMIR